MAVKVLSASPYEEPIRTQLTELRLSQSHTEEHLDRVLTFALDLQIIYGGDIDVLCASALLHDLGRSDTRYHGTASSALSAENAREILSAISFPQEKLAAVLQAISEHDQPEVRPTTLEGRLLKDADFLAGMGALGVARSALWTGESGGTLADFLDRLVRKMPARIASLEFPESRYQATRDYVFAALFASKVQIPSSLGRLPVMPYVLFEGISGTGKTTQVDMLVARFSRSGISPFVVREPTPWFRQVRSSLTSRPSDKAVELALLLADRFTNLAIPIRDALTANQPVISDRSYISSMVYQADGDDPSPADIAYMHRLLPQPTSIILLDVEPEVALARVDKRTLSGKSVRGAHETLEQLATHRQRFLSLTSIFPLMHVLNAQVAPDLLHDQVWQALLKDMPTLGELA